MKHLIKSISIFVGVSAFAASSVFAQINTIKIDENGNGFFNGAPMPGALTAVDPSGGVAGPVLIYTLPAVGQQITIGDVVLTENVGGNTNVSDVIRFWEFGQIIFYSDRSTNEPPDGDLADISGLPAQLLSNRVLLQETGVEGNNGASYLATPGLPGWDGNPAGTQYQFISDVPEPGTALLTGAGLLLLLQARRRVRR